MNSGEQKSHETLNAFQANRVRITCQYIDKLLSDIEGILSSAASRAAFPRYADDILPAQRRTIDDYIARIRAQLVRILEGQAIQSETPSIPSSRAIRANLGAIDIAAEELKPRYMRGYGEVPDTVAIELQGIAGELAGLIRRFEQYLSQDAAEDFEARLKRLARAGHDLQLLGKIEQSVRNCGLVEFRPSIAAILDRAADRTFEIAVFGRISAGKSSLLNAMLETDVLPVGVTPVTAVPTHIVYSETPSLTVSFAEASTKHLAVANLREFATEQENPGNWKQVTRLLLALPSRRLRGGVAFVDTPGLGSLAGNGTTETLAYLPKCDLGVVLIDAASGLTAEDLHTILALQQAAIPINVVLSKADLSGSDDRDRIIAYANGHIAAECRVSLCVDPVSALSSCRAMLDEWFDRRIVPLYARSHELRMESVERKIGALRESVVAALEARLKRGSRSSTESQGPARVVESLLRTTTGSIQELREVADRFVRDAGRSLPNAIEAAAKELLHARETGSYGVVVPGQLVRDSIAQFVHAKASKLQTELATQTAAIGAQLRQCADYLGISDSPSNGELQSLVRGAPVFEMLPSTLAISHFRFSRLLGRRAVESLARRQILRQLPAAFHAAFETYWQLVGAWAESVISRLTQKFEMYAESYRAQAGQILADGDFSKDELTTLETSLQELKPGVAEVSEI